jgi:hypothetical protein
VHEVSLSFAKKTKFNGVLSKFTSLGSRDSLARTSWLTFRRILTILFR